MKMNMCAVHDGAVGAFMQPLFCRSLAEARRAFVDAVMDPKMEFGKHPADYHLFHIAEWDDAGTLTPLPAPVKLMSALDCMPVS